MPLFTIGITTYNRPAFLHRAIHSVLEQSNRDFELIIIDDASDTDETRRTTELFSDKRLRYIRNDNNRGIAANINRVFSEAQGEYIGFLGDDDVFSQTLLEKTEAIIREKGKYEFIGFNLSLVDENGETLCDNYFNICHDLVFKRYHYVEYHFGGRQNFHIPGTFFVRKEFLERHGILYRPEVKGIDVFFSLEVNCYTDIYVAAEPLYIHTRHRLQESHRQNRPIEWKLSYYAGLRQLLSAKGLNYLEPLLRRCFLPYFPGALLERSSAESGEAATERLDVLIRNFYWMLEAHPAFSGIRLFYRLWELEHGEITDLTPVTSISAEHLPPDHYTMWLMHLENKRKGICSVLRKRSVSNVAVYGALFTGLLLSMDLKLENFQVRAYLDNHKKTEYLNGIKVVSPDWLAENHVDAVIISFERETPEVVSLRLKELAEDRGIPVISWRSIAEESMIHDC